MQTQLTSQHLEQLQTALLDAFDPAALTQLVRFGLELDPKWITPVQSKRDLTTVVTDLVAYCASQEGGLKRLLAAACEQNPDNSLLASLASQWATFTFVPIALSENHPSIRAEERGVVAGGDINKSTIVTGDGNTVQQIGRDKIVHGDEVHGDKVEGDQYNVETQVIGYTAEQVAVIIAEIRRDDQPKRWNGRTPYVGLDSFREDQANLFFGRDKLISHLLIRIQASRFLCITGPSGSGKSSLVQAGLLPALHTSRIPGSEQWLFETVTPGNQPLENLALAMGRLANSPSAAAYLRSQAATDPAALYAQVETLLGHHPHQRALIVVDQFEELFTQSKDEAVQLAFLALLTNAAQQAAGRVIVLLVMRSDFVSQCANYPELRQLISGNLELVGAMEPHELTQAIVMPALEVGVEVKPDLVAQVITDMRGEPGALPLMQFALKDLFDTQTAQPQNQIVLTLQEYLVRGGIQQALERHANAQFAKFSRAEQTIAAKIFMSLIEIGQGTVDTRRIATFSELLPMGADSDPIEKVIKALADARLITTDTLQPGAETNPSIETRNVTIAHEKLIEVWPWLAQLVRENRALIELQNQISTDALKWDKNDRDPSYLYIGTRLQSVREQLTARQLTLGPFAHQLITASIQAETEQLRQIESDRQRELDNQRQLVTEQSKRADAEERRTQLFRGATAIVTLLLFVALGFGGWGWRNSINASNNEATAVAARAAAETNSAYARSRQLAAQSASELTNNHYEPAILLAIESGRITDTFEAFAAIRAAIANPWHSRILLQGYEISQVTWSQDGNKLLIRSYDSASVWDAASGKELVKLEGHTGTVWQATWSQDESKILTSSSDGTARIWDAVSGKELVKLEGHTRVVWQAMWSRDESKILTSSDDHTARIWEVASGKELVKLEGHTDYVTQATWSRDESKILTTSGDGTARIWDAASGKELVKFEGHVGRVSQATWNRDESKILTSSADETARIWDAASGKELVKLAGHTGEVSQATWNQDESKILTISAYYTASIWDVASGKELVKLLGVNQAMWSRDGSKILTNSVDLTLISEMTSLGWAIAKTASIWDAASGKELIKLAGHTGAVSQTTWNRDESKILTSSSDGTARIWDAASGQELVKLEGHIGEVSQATWNRDESKILTSSSDGTARIWDAASGQELVKLAGHTGKVSQATWNRDESKILTSSSDDSASVWDAASGKELVKLEGHTESVNQATWNQDESKILTSSADGTARIWDAAGGQELVRLEGISQATWNRDGSKILTSSNDGTARIWDAASGKELVKLEGYTSVVFQKIWSPDESKILTRSDDHVVSIWDVASGKELVKLQGHTSVVFQTIWSQDGSKILTSSDDRTARIWDAASGQELVELYGVYYATWNRDESKILTNGADITARIWDAASGKELVKLESVAQATWNQDESKILTNSYDNTARIWDTASGKELVTLEGHVGRVSQATWNRDESKILTRSDDYTVRIWEAASGKELVRLEGHTGSVTQATWNWDESKILTSSEDGTARIWYVRMADLIDAACHWTPRNMSQSEWSLYMEGAYRPTCPTVQIPLDVIETIQTESQALIQQGEVISATQQLEQLNGWLKTSGQFSTYGVDVSAFVAQVADEATAEAPPPPTNTP